MTDMTVANTIRQQLGGNRFCFMTGAKHWVGDDNSVSFQLPKANKGIKAVTIILNAHDYYDVLFFNRKNFNIVTIAEVTDVSCDDLQSVFTANTGLYTHL
jgi:hypothetical protein